MADGDGFGLYVHWPYCETKCPYCDFNSYTSGPNDTETWTRAFIAEIERHAALTGPRQLQSIYFGGGTPSLMDPKTVEAVIAAAHRHWSFSNTIEITLEANPSSVEQSRFQAFKAAGVNRVSLGVQALNPDDLRRLGRIHSVDDALAAIACARDIFPRVSFDLIYARQDQSLADWEGELSTAIGMGPDHLSLYQLTIEPGTAFHERFHRGGLRGLPDEDVAADMFDLTQQMTAAAGLPAYEVSNHAKQGQDSTHNNIYWSGGDYVGIGPGAHGRISVEGQRHETQTHLRPKDWLEGVAAGSGTLRSTAMGRADIAAEYVMMGLRRRGGIDLGRLADIAGGDVPIPDHLFELGLVRREDTQLAVTDAGLLLLNRVISEILP